MNLVKLGEEYFNLDQLVNTVRESAPQGRPAIRLVFSNGHAFVAGPETVPSFDQVMEFLGVSARTFAPPPRRS